MKKMMMFLGFTLFSVALMAQGTVAEPAADAGAVVDVTTFTGMMAVITSIVTQLAKLIPLIAGHKWAKVLCALVVGMAATMVCWALQVSDFLVGLPWWQALIAGVAAGLSAAGFYDVIKALWSIFKPDEK